MYGLMMDDQLTIGSLIDHAGRFHSATGLVSVETDGSVTRPTWGEVAAGARRLGSALTALGLAPGTRCGTIAWNNRRHLEVYFGVSSAGFVCHTINPRLFPEQIVYVVGHAEDRVLFFDRTFVPLVAGLRERLTTLEHFVLMGPLDAEAAEAIPGLRSYDDLVAGGDAGFAWPELDERTASSLCYTSGTTGNPKGVLYSHRSTVIHALASAQPDMMGLSAREVMLPVVPMFHVNAWGIPYAAALTGAPLVLPGPGLDGASLVGLIDRERVTVAAGVPTIWKMLLDAAEAAGSSLESLQRTIVGGSACPAYMIDAFRERHGVEVLHAWGMTEMSPLGSVNQPLLRHRDLPVEQQRERRLCAGRPPWGIDMRIVDDAGRRLAEDGVAEGHLHVRGPWVLSSYFGSDGNDLLDGWFPTGDVARIDAEGYVEIRDRSKDVIKSGGEWISSVELENIALAHPDLADAAVIGCPDETWGERPVLVAVAREGCVPRASDLLGFFGGKVARWQVPDRVVYVDALPRNATGKVRKNVLRQEIGDGAGSAG